MSLPFVGKARNSVLEELRDTWFGKDGLAVAILEGFSGCGKTALGRDLANDLDIAFVYVDAHEDDPNLQDLFLDLAIALEAIGIDDLSNETKKDTGSSFGSALRQTIRRHRVLVVIDEAQHTFLPDAARPVAKLAGVIEQLGKNESAGRLLLISNRIGESAPWSENCFRVTLPPLAEEEAVELLTQLLRHQNCLEKVDSEFKAELVRCLGYNPRAIHTLVTCLEFETLDNLITSAGIWDLRDVEVSPELVAQLERQLFGRILPKLEDDKNTSKFLRWLSVHRQPFQKEALAQFQGAGFSSAELVRSLVERMLLEYRHGWHTVNTIAREISVQRLKESASEWVQAHSLAANYHARRFRVPQVAQAERLAGSFAELRYHLYHAKRIKELEHISAQFTEFIRHSIQISQIPSDPAKLAERIALLSVLLTTQGAKGLEFHLARCLLERNAAGDRKAALEHIRRATGPQAPCDAWLVRMELEWEFGGDTEAVWNEALLHLPSSNNSVAIYRKAAHILARDGHIDKAIALLRKGIWEISAEHGQSALYKQCAELLVHDGDLDAAMELLQEGLELIPSKFGLASLYQLRGELLARSANLGTAIKQIQDGIEKLPSESTLYQLCGELMARHGDLVGALGVLREGFRLNPRFFRLMETALRLAAFANRKDLIEELAEWAEGVEKNEFSVPMRFLSQCFKHWVDEEWGELLATAEKGLNVCSSVPLIMMKAEAHIAVGQFENAWLDFSSYEKRGKYQKEVASLWLKAWIALRTDRQEDADRLAGQYSALPIAVPLPITETALIQLWLTAHSGINHPLTKFFRSLGCWLGRPATDAEPAPAPARTAANGIPSPSRFLLIATEWDSKNGGLSTFNRMLCKALADARQNVVCYVPHATSHEIQRAALDGVHLVAAQQTPGLSSMACLFNMPDEIKNLGPDFLVGHDRQTGAYAKVLQKQSFSESQRIHFIHTAPEEIESSKPSRPGTAAKRGESHVNEQKDQAHGAVLIVAVGPRLAREFGTQVYGAPGFPPVHELIPGFDLEETHDLPQTSDLPPGIVCLVLGRAEDYELKGLDLAAKAMGIAISSWQPMALPKFVVRGAPQGTGDDLIRKLQSDITCKRPLQPTVREYSENLEAIQSDLRGSSLLLMPSCVEGFGLVAAEAIRAGVPILISEQSGIAEILPDTMRGNILPTRPSALTPLDDIVIKKWADAIAVKLAPQCRRTAFDAARQLKQEMKTQYTWQDSIDKLLCALEIS